MSLNGARGGITEYWDITGLIAAGTNVTITGDGTLLNPYIVNSTGGGGMAIGDAVTSGTSGSVLFVDASGNLAQDNSKLFYKQPELGKLFRNVLNAINYP